MSLYFDTSALAKLILTEVYSTELREWLDSRDAPAVVTCSVGSVELHRLAHRVSPMTSAAAVMLLARIDILELTPTMLALAGQLPPPEVRTLDALHIAAAASLSDLDALVTYDRRMTDAARGYGLPTVSPS